MDLHGKIMNIPTKVPDEILANPCSKALAYRTGHRDARHAAAELVAGGCNCDMRTKLVGDGCEICNPELAADIARDNLEDAADSVASEVLHHIDQMYPAMWEGVPKAARTSVRNTIRQQVIRYLSPNARDQVPGARAAGDTSPATDC